MPLYDYRCTECSEVTEVVAFMHSKPETVQCKSCSAIAKFCFLPPTKKLKKKEPLKIKVPRLTIHKFYCDDCNTTWDEVVERDIDAPPQEGRACVSCGAHAKHQPSCKIDRWSEQFPYYDRGLGVMLHNKQQRKDICKERGLTPVDGDWDIESEYSKWDSRVEKETAEYEDYCDKLDNHPGFKTFRKKRDLGLI
jgi:putative FmdB family regulatory protein